MDKMEKVTGISERDDRLIRFKTGKTVLVYGYWEEEVDGGLVGCSWKHIWYTSPSSAEIMEAITDAVNRRTDSKILTGYKWNNQSVYLSSENQFNFKAAYDMAVQTNGSILPVTFKLGEDSNGSPVYYTFEDMATFSEFYMGAIAFIQQTLADGWAEKDAARVKFNL